MPGRARRVVNFGSAELPRTRQIVAAAALRPPRTSPRRLPATFSRAGASLAWLDANGFDARRALAPTRACLDAAARAAVGAFGERGICAEFGVYHGRSLRALDAALPEDWELHGFDSFVGLPEAWRHEAAGSCVCGAAHIA